MPHTTTERGHDPVVGRMLDGRYLVGARIARGGMATVYEGTDTRLDRPVAVKVMHPGLGEDAEFTRRFQREARAAARLSHPDVVAVYDRGEDDGTLFLVMEYVPGRTLRDLIRSEAPLAPRRVLALMEPVLSALAAAHATGLVHRDVKPENVLIADDGRTKVVDFGLAKAVDAETSHTGTQGVLIGTVSYLSPELVVDGLADARADVYAAGVILFEMLTGRKPHQADSPIQVAYKHVHEDVPAPSTVIPSLPAYVDALVARATARDAALRPADAGVLLHHVRRVRSALEHGVAEDGELTEELTPAHSRDRFVDTDDQMPVAIVDPDDVRPEARADAVYDQEAEDTSAFRAASPQDRPTPPRAATNGSRRPPPPQAVPLLPPRPRGTRRLAPVALVLVLTLALAGVGYWLLVARYTQTPAVLNLRSATAAQKVEQAGLRYSVAGRDYSETVRRGMVLRTDPAPGGRVLDGGTVAAVLSRGPERHAVPSLRGRSLDEAQRTLAAEHLSFGQEKARWSESVDEGDVIRSLPEPGTALRRDAGVDLVVSKGPKPIEVPDLAGDDADEATAALEKLGLEVRESREYSDSVPRGDVVSQSPASGEVRHRGDTVRLVVSRGPRLVAVPDTRRMGLDAARRTLAAAGFQVRTQQSEIYVGLQYVVRTDPAGGTRVPRGSTITLYLV